MHVNACSTGNAHPTPLLVAVLFVQWRSCYVYHRNSKERVAPVETSLVNKAQKMVLNMLSTGAMVRLGHVYGNLMVNLRQKNSKLIERALIILQTALNVDRARARELLLRAGNDVPVAIVMSLAGVSRKTAEKVLKGAGGVRAAVESVRLRSRAEHV